MKLKRIPVFVCVLLANMGPALAAETTVRIESVPDANPECMERNGPDCVLRSQVVPPRTATQPGGVVGPAATLPGTAGTTASGSATIITPDNSTVIAPANSSVITPGSTVFTPSSGSTIIAPRRK